MKRRLRRSDSLVWNGEGVEGRGFKLDAWVRVPVVELVVVTAKDGGGGGAVAVLRFAHQDGADLAEETICAVEEVELGAFDIDLDEVRCGRVIEEPVERDAENPMGLACAASLRVFGNGGQVAGGAVAVCDVKGFDARLTTDCDRQNVYGSGVGPLSRYGTLQQGGEPEVGLDGDDHTSGAGFLGGGDGEETDVGADVPDNVSRVDELASEAEQVGFEAGFPVAETRFG